MYKGKVLLLLLAVFLFITVQAQQVLELSKQTGVSPCYWWADVPVKKKTAIYIKKDFSLSDAPKVKYRGIFINDEAPVLSGWTKEKLGGFNYPMYEKCLNSFCG